MFQVAAALILLLQISSAEPPVNGYLPSNKDTPFAKIFSPPAANVSFNFGYSPRSTKRKFSDEPRSSEASYYRNRDDFENSDKNGSNEPGVVKNVHSIDDYHHELKSYNSMTEYQQASYGAPSISEHSYASKMPYMKYGAPADDGLPVIEENLVQRKAQIEHRNNNQNAPTIQPDHMSNRGQLGYQSSRSSTGHTGSDGKDETYPYEFSYEVMSPVSGVSLGHHENHDGSSAEGVYHNLLPDGRLLTVEYWADDGGFKPRLSYKQVYSSKRENSGPY